jgi:membrane-associated protease RseP (regulator of RpoE activity)
LPVEPVAHSLRPMGLFSSGSVILLGVLGIGFVIFIHELGHFLFAKWAGVRVDTFSIGFGPIVWSKTIGETEYALSILPLGGYVAMREKADGSGRSMEESTAPWRAAILAGGVLFNLVSSFLLLLCLAWYGMPTIPPVVGDPLPKVLDHEGQIVDGPAASLGLRSGDRIVEIHGTEPRSFEDLIAATIDHPTEALQLVVERDGERLALPPAGAEPVFPVYRKDLGRVTLGINAPLSNRIDAVAGHEAEALGIQPGDRVVAIAGESVEGEIGQELERRLLPYIGSEVVLGLERADGTRFNVTVPFASSRPATISDAGLGFPVAVAGLTPGMPAQRAGVQPGDILSAVDGQVVSTVEHFSALIRRADETDKPFILTVMRPQADGSWASLDLSMTTEFHEPTGRRLIGVQMDGMRGGRLPLLPPALRSTTSPLANAGLEPGDVVIGSRALSGDDNRSADGMQQVEVLYLRQGEIARVAIPASAGSALLRPYEPPLLRKFLGARPRVSIAERLLGTRVLAVGGEGAAASVIVVDDPQTETRTDAVDLASVSEPGRSDILSALQVGDWIVDWDATVDEEDGFVLTLLRGNERAEPVRAIVTPADPGIAIAFAFDEQPYQLKAWHEAFGLAGQMTGEILTTTFGMIPKFFRSADEGGVDASKSLTGPIGIFSELKARAERGFASFLKILAVLGLNLVIVNLLPIPIADGGRLLMLLVEVITRRPVPEKVESAINTIGFVLILCLMMFVIGVDVLREMGRH